MKKRLYILLLLPLFFVSSCKEDIEGCTNEDACNFNINATNPDDASCEYSALGFDCEGIVTAQIGDVFEGGYLFYLDETGKHGLVAALEDLGSFQWGCDGTELSGADALSIGTGLQNTLDIVAGCSDTLIAGSEALNTSIEGYTDWYLASSSELQELYNTIGNGGSEGNIGGFQDSYYWSSSENADNLAFGVNFNSGEMYKRNKYLTRLVRVIRSF